MFNLKTGLTKKYDTHFKASGYWMQCEVVDIFLIRKATALHC